MFNHEESIRCPHANKFKVIDDIYVNMNIDEEV